MLNLFLSFFYSIHFDNLILIVYYFRLNLLSRIYFPLQVSVFKLFLKSRLITWPFDVNNIAAIRTEQVCTIH